MKTHPSSRLFSTLCLPAIMSLVVMTVTVAEAQIHIPGAGKKINQVGDDFEDPEWKFNLNWPKSSHNIDKRSRDPAGESVNGRWYEGMKRGIPDFIRRVDTPEGGLAGSKGSLLLRSMITGIPGRPSHKQQQDDFIADVMYRLDGAIPVNRAPSVVVRVYLPPFEEWEDRSGCSFAFRSSLEPSNPKPKSRGLFASKSDDEPDTYWPGFLFDFERKEDNGTKTDKAFLRIRANSYGEDYTGPELTQTGWWTLGMSFTPDGRVHYFAKPGIENLTAKDHIVSHFPYGFKAKELNTFFFNVCSADDGKTWSTEWIVDDPAVYILR